jgi:hypothetical protein
MDDEDPFGIFSDANTVPTPQLGRNSSIRRSYDDVERSTISLTHGGSSIYSDPSPTSPTFSSYRYDQERLHKEREDRESMYNPNISSPKPQRALGGSLSIKKELRTPMEPGLVRAIALFDYEAQQVCRENHLLLPSASLRLLFTIQIPLLVAFQNGDLSFKKGSVITIVKKTESSDDW